MGGPLAGKTIAVIGAGPAGATAAYLLARSRLPRVLLFDQRPLLRPPEAGEKIPACGGCGGLVQASVMTRLKSIGLTLGSGVVQAHLDGYTIHYLKRSITLEIPSQGMVAVYRGWGPVRGGMARDSFDSSLAHDACAAGAEFLQEQVTGIQLGDGVGGPAAIVTAGSIHHADFVVGAFGHNRALSARILTSRLQPAPLDVPRIVRGAVREYEFGVSFVEQTYRRRVHVIFEPTPNIWFAALIPKGPVVSIVLMGHRDTKAADFDELFALPSMQGLLPAGDTRQHLKCGCVRSSLTVSSPRRFLVPDTGGIALIGDAGPTRPRKNGLFAAIDLAQKLATCLERGGFSAQALRPFQYYALLNYVVDDMWADRTLALTGDVARIPVLGSLAVRALAHGCRLPVLTSAMQEYARLILTGEAPYWWIPFGVLSKLFGM